MHRLKDLAVQNFFLVRDILFKLADKIRPFLRFASHVCMHVKIGLEKIMSHGLDKSWPSRPTTLDLF